MGIIAGYYFGIKINNNNIPQEQAETIKKNVSLFTALIMFLICIATGMLAMLEKTLGEELQKMLGLGFEVTRGMIITIILIGGLSLIFIQYWLTKTVMTKTIIKSMK